MNEEIIIEKTIEFVKKSFENAKPSHDFFHVQRVYNMAIHIAQEEGGNMLIVKLGALLHDIADYKYHDGDDSLGPKVAGDFLHSIGVDEKTILEVQNIIQYISYSTNLSNDISYSTNLSNDISYSTNLSNDISYKSRELDIVQDADKLDAIGAIGIARCLCFSGEKSREIYNPEISPKLNMSKEEYKKNKSTAINHFYEKLLKLKDLMNTQTAKNIALERHEFMEKYLEQFMKEINF